MLDAKVSNFGEINDLVSTKEEDALVVCCIDANRNPLKYKIEGKGPLHCEGKTSQSFDVLSFGPLSTPLHVDVV